MVLSSGLGIIGSVIQILGMLIAFILILGAAYFVSKYLSKYSLNSRSNSNIQTIETIRIAPDRYLQIIKVGDEYFLIGISKSSISLISKLNEESIKDIAPKEAFKFSFKEFLDKAKSKEK